MHPTVDELRSCGVFSDQPTEKLRWLASLMDVQEFEAGDVISREGDPATHMVVILEGEVQGRNDNNGMDTTIYQVGAGEVTGKLPFSRMVDYPLTMRAVTKTRIAKLACEHFEELGRRIPDVMPQLVSAMVDRARETTEQTQNKDKMAALGRVSAGIAHELNNPAAAANRAAANIRESLATLRKADRTLAGYSLNADQYCVLAEVEEELARRAREAPALDALERSDREQAIGDVLDGHNVDNAWDLAGCLVDANFTEPHLKKLLDALPAEVLEPALSRLGASVTLARLAEEIIDSTTRVSDLVKAIKEYSYMDRTPDQPVDVHRSLESTLAVLKHLLKSGIKLVRDYDRELPIIEGYGSELNQVWTNIIDNAVAAMEGKGELRIRTGRELDGIFVEIGDNGPGIAPEDLNRIWEPFFTTKKVGEGTGLGLGTVLNIVNKHRGTIKVESVAGDTRFKVWLPLTQVREEQPAQTPTS